MSTTPMVPGRTPAPPATKRPLVPPPAANTPGPKTKARTARAFSIKPWGGDGEGEKIVIYGESGMGKSTLALLAPGAVFIGVDDGARKLRHPTTGQPVNAVMGIENFYDYLDAIAADGLFDGVQTVVIDTITMLEELSESYMFDTIKAEKGRSVTSIEGYGYGKGYRHALEVMTKILQDLEVRFVRKGINVILLAQESTATMANAEGLDFLVAGPKLHHSKQHSSRLKLQEWADHVLRISFAQTLVSGNDGATKGKVVGNNTDRVVNTAISRHYFAKSRTLTEPVISFASPADDSLWQFMFPGGK